MRKILLLSLVQLFVLVSFAQKRKLSMQDAMINVRTSLAPENLRFLQFVKGTNDYVYVKKSGGTERWIKGSMDAVKESEYLSLADLNNRLRAAALDTLTVMPPTQFERERFIVNLKGRKYRFDMAGDGYAVIIDSMLASKKNLDESKSGNMAYLDGHDLYVYSKGKAVRVTNDGSENIVYGSSVHREEFGIVKGTFWSNDGKKLAFYRMDQRMVRDYPIIDWSVLPAKAEMIKYPMAGDSSHQVTVHVYDTETGRLIKLNTGEPDDHYLTNIAWSPDDKSVFMAELNRGQNDLRLNQYDAQSGSFIKTHIQEKADYGYVEPLFPVLFLKNQPGQYIWQSRSSGWNHLYLCSVEKGIIKPLTTGNWEVLDVKGFDEKGENLFFISTEVSPVSRNLYRLHLKTGKRFDITGGNYVHNTQISSDGSFILDVFSSPDIPRKINLIETKTGKTKELLRAEDPLQQYHTGRLDIFTIKSEKSGYDLYCRRYLPVDFDSSRKYPVIIYWYGGPHSQLITNSWNGGSGDYWFQYLAGQGFLVFSMDVRGSANRGRYFEDAIFRNVGVKQMEDLKSGISYLGSLPYADTSRMGLFGWSFGGFLTTGFLLENPGVFKAAVAGGPVMDWKLYEVMYTERYMDTPSENPEGYKATNLISRAGDLKDKLLIIHGLQDPVVLQQHSVNFVKAAVDKGVQVDYMIYPGHEHNVTGRDRLHLYQKVTDYFFLHLK